MQPPNLYLSPTHPQNAGTWREALLEALDLLSEYRSALEETDPSEPEQALERIKELLERLAESSYSINVAIAAERQQAAIESEEGVAPLPPEIDKYVSDVDAMYAEKYRAAFLLAKWRLLNSSLGCKIQLAFDLLFAGRSSEQRREILRWLSDAVRHGVVWMHRQTNEEDCCCLCGQPGVTGKERREHAYRFDKQTLKRRQKGKQRSRA
jgi:hypothetical protein